MEEKLKKQIKFLKIATILVTIMIVVEFFATIFWVTGEECSNGSGGSSIGPYTINNRFIPYTGEKVTGTNVKTLIDKVISYNLTEAEDESQFIKVVIGDATNESANGATQGQEAIQFNEPIRRIRSEITSRKSYKVTYGISSKTGLIIAIGIETIEENNELEER